MAEFNALAAVHCGQIARIDGKIFPSRCFETIFFFWTQAGAGDVRSENKRLEISKAMIGRHSDRIAVSSAGPGYPPFPQSEQEASAE